MFDRGLLSLTDGYEILMVKKLIPAPITRLLNPDGKILLPADPSLCPHPQFLQYHREHISRGQGRYVGLFQPAPPCGTTYQDVTKAKVSSASVANIGKTSKIRKTKKAAKIPASTEMAS
jgi:hypothetical protein